MDMAESELTDILQLINSENVGPVTFYKLIKEFGSPKQAIIEAEKIKKIHLCNRRWAEDEIIRAQNLGISLISYKDRNFPPNLKLIEDCPPVLYVRGNVQILQNPNCIAVIGARNASINGRKTAAKIAFDLSTHGVCIVSGMARGIDAAAHKGAMHACNKQGETIAVLGCGADIAYPKENTDIYAKIISQGCVVSELPIGTPPQANFFPRRNRIVAALSLATLVVEATLKSGSLITADLARSMNRGLFAVPGYPNDPRAEGTNKLIKEGAVLVENASDILSSISSPQIIKHPKKSISVQKPLVFATKDANLAANKTCSNIKISDYLNYDGVYVDEIIRLSGLSASEVAFLLLELELEGKIERQSGNKVALIK